MAARTRTYRRPDLRRALPCACLLLVAVFTLLYVGGREFGRFFNSSSTVLDLDFFLRSLFERGPPPTRATRGSAVPPPLINTSRAAWVTPSDLNVTFYRLANARHGRWHRAPTTASATSVGLTLRVRRLSIAQFWRAAG